MALVVCGRCQRHVKRGEAVCPFCGAPRSAARLGLGAAVILGTGLCLGGCGTSSDLGGGDASASTDGSSESDSGVQDARHEGSIITDSGYLPYDSGGFAPTDAADVGPVPPYGPVPIYSSVPKVE
jgi:hypothetical protein